MVSTKKIVATLNELSFWGSTNSMRFYFHNNDNYSTYRLKVWEKSENSLMQNGENYID